MCSATHNAILHAKAQLVFEVRSFDEDCGHRRAAHNVQFHLHLVLQTLRDPREHRLRSTPIQLQDLVITLV